MHTVSENQCGKYALLLQQARTEAQLMLRRAFLLILTP